MIRSIVYYGVNTQYREASQNTGLCCLFDTFADCRDVLLRNRTTDNLRLELEQLFSVGIHRLEANLTVSVLSTSTGLLSILAVYVNSLGEGLFVSYLRCAYVSLYLELTQQTVYDDFQMQLAHSCDNSLTSFLIGVRTEGRVLLCQLCKSLAHLALTSLGLRLDSQLDNRLRELHGLQDYRMLLVTDGITGCGELESNCCCDITGIYLVQLCSLICVHLKDTSYTLLLLLCRVIYIRTGIHGS